MNRSPSFSFKSEPSSNVDTDALQQWVVAFCVIRFDLEQGQVVEECYPPGSLTKEEELETAFSSFPDSVSQQHNRSSIHDCIFFFRIRRRGNNVPPKVLSSQIAELGGDGDLHNSKVNIKFRNGHDTKCSRFLYGYVFNRQRHDERLKRGGEQKSVVILSTVPFSSVFRPLLQIMGPLYFDIGRKALEHIGAYVSLWPVPVPGKLMELPIGNASFKVYLPPSHSLPHDSKMLLDESSSSMAPFLPMNQSVPQGLFHDSDLFGIFKGILVQLWILWELLLIGEPILIIAPTPPQCCEAVAGLVSLMAPLLCSVDFRPYFTIHDPEFTLLNSLQEGDKFPSVILGVTNLFFLKALRCIPHVVSVGHPTPTSSRSNSIMSRSAPGRVVLDQSQGFSLQRISLRRFSPLTLLNAVKMRRDGPLCLMTEHREAIWSTYNATTKPDTSILNRLVDAGMSLQVEESMSVVNNEILRRHFLELTTNFLAPFGPYFKANTPCEGSSPFLDPPALPTFNADEFLASLAARGPGKFLLKRMRSNWLDLYRHFLKGHNFQPWFERRRAVAEKEQHKLWRQARMQSDVNLFISHMSELEAVDSFHAIEKHLLEEMQGQESGSSVLECAEACQKLRGDLRAVFSVLPNDTQDLLLMKPGRDFLLGASPENPGDAMLQVRPPHTSLF